MMIPVFRLMLRLPVGRESLRPKQLAFSYEQRLIGTELRVSIALWHGIKSAVVTARHQQFSEFVLVLTCTGSAVSIYPF